MRSSLTRNFMIGLGAASVAFTILVSLSAFAIFQNELARRQIAFLSKYVQERADNLDHTFVHIQAVQRSAAELLRRREAMMGPAETKTVLNRDMPLLPDGTRRSLAEDFDGSLDASGRLTYGMGAFLGQGARIGPEEAKGLAAAYGVVSTVGQAIHGEYDNFYFFTPNNRLVIFGPDRPDHLMYYRKDAPADLDFSHEEMVTLARSPTLPTTDTRCTSLQRLIQNSKDATALISCLTPAVLHGRVVGAFGSTINVEGLFADAEQATLSAASTMIVRPNGQLLAYPPSVLPRGATENQVVAASHRLKLAGLMALVERHGGRNGLIVSPDGKFLVAYSRLDGPGWYFLLSYPAAAVTWSAVRSASLILVLGLLASVLQTLTILRMARRTIVRPLQTLADSCAAHDGDGARALEGRADEIGVLARALGEERDRADEVTASLEQRVSDRTAELERANAEKSRFLANMSHELRTPLNGVIAISEVLEREQTTPRNVELAQLVTASGRLLEQVLTDILDFSKIEAGEMRLESQPFDLETTVFRVAELHRASADAKGVALRWSVDEGARGLFMGDAVRLTQVLSNLLSNAVKFTAQGEVALGVVCAGGSVHFTVCDTGMGFDEAAKAKLFHRFEQADVSIRRRFGGTGLGLAICRSLVSLMGGEIDATSTPGEGATFEFSLPLPRAAAPAAATPEPLAAAPHLEAVQVLLAEDHPTNQRVVRLILEAAGIELTVVENGALALDAFARQRFDVILMDMQMPEMDGLTATRRLRETEAASGARPTPIVMLTANALDEHVRASLAAGADRHLSKPLRAADLLDAIADLLDEPDGASEAERSAA